MAIQSSPGPISINGVPLVPPQSFANHTEILDLFGLKYKKHRESYYQLPGDILIWFPRRIANGRRYVFRGDVIEENCAICASQPSVRDLLVRNHKRITFVQDGNRYYYVGVYVYDRPLGKNVQSYRKIADSVRLESRIL